MALGCRGRDDGSLPKRLAWFAKQDDWQNYGVSAKSLEIVWWNSKKVDKFWCESWKRLWMWMVPYTICQCMSCLGLGSGVQAGNAGSAFCILHSPARKPLNGLFQTQPKSKQFETIPTSKQLLQYPLCFAMFESGVQWHEITKFKSTSCHFSCQRLLWIYTGHIWLGKGPRP